MINSHRAKERSATFLSEVLLEAAASCREGDFRLAEALGFEIDDIRELEALNPADIHRAAKNSSRDCCAFEAVKVNTNQLKLIVSSANRATTQQEMIDRFIKAGACNAMLDALFGARSSHIANRKRLLGLEVSKGKKRAYPTVEQEQVVYSSWLANLHIADVKDRYLAVHNETGEKLAIIYKVTESIIEVTPNKAARKIA